MIEATARRKAALFEQMVMHAGLMDHDNIEVGGEDFDLAITLSPQAAEMVVELLGSGLYGANIGDVVERLVYDRLRELFPVTLTHRGETKT